jgi:hypothetical protein
MVGARRGIRFGSAHLKLRHQRQLAALLVGNFRGDLPHLDEALRRRCMRGGIGTDVIGLALEADAEGQRAGLFELLCKYTAGADAAEQETGIGQRAPRLSRFTH